jgi:Ca2+-binding RTX toxin-like protein
MRFTGRRNQFSDTIWSDLISATNDEDMVEITWGNDTVMLGDGDDVLWDRDGNSAYGNDIWLPSNDLIYGGKGRDLIQAGRGADTIDGGDGWDTVDYRYSKAAIVVDLAKGLGGGSSLSGSAGDVLRRIEQIEGSRYSDTIKAGSGAHVLNGGDGNDVLHGGGSGSTLRGDAGNDTLFALATGGTFDGGDGFDTLSWIKMGQGVRIGYSDREAPGLLAAQAGNNIEEVVGTHFADKIRIAGFGDASERLHGMNGNDWLSTNIGDDTIYGGNGHDTLLSGGDDDLLFGDAGNDALGGGSHDDRLFGGAGNDSLIGGQGADTMTGGSGADVFVFDNDSRWLGGENDVITDFTRGLDRIDLSAMDAIHGPAGDQAFTLRLNFSRDAPVPGTLVAAQQADGVMLSGYVFDHGATSFTIHLQGVTGFSAADIIL